MRLSCILVLGLVTGPIYGQVSVRETAWGGDPNYVTIDNQTYNNYAISRLGNPDAQIVPKRLESPVSLKLTTAGGSQDMLQLHVGDKIIPETAFDGFSGIFGASVKLIITDPSSSPNTSKTTNSTSSNTSGSASTTTSGYSGGGYAGGGMSSGGYGGYGTRGAISSQNSPNDEKSKLSEVGNSILGTNKPGKKLNYPGAAGVRIRVEPEETKITPPEPPPVQIKKATASPAVITTTPDVADEPIQEKKKKDVIAIVVWSLISAGLLGIVVFKRMQSKPAGGR